MAAPEGFPVQYSEFYTLGMVKRYERMNSDNNAVLRGICADVGGEYVQSADYNAWRGTLEVPLKSGRVKIMLPERTARWFNDFPVQRPIEIYADKKISRIELILLCHKVTKQMRAFENSVALI